LPGQDGAQVLVERHGLVTRPERVRWLHADQGLARPAGCFAEGAVDVGELAGAVHDAQPHTDRLLDVLAEGDLAAQRQRRALAGGDLLAQGALVVALRAAQPAQTGTHQAHQPDRQHRQQHPRLPPHRRRGHRRCLRGRQRHRHIALHQRQRR
jgi:hypothetical protein